MLLAAPVLAGNAPEEAQGRALARYTFLWADALLEWARRWRNELARSDDKMSSKHAHRMKPELGRFADLLGQVGGVRDYLVAKRQPLAASRADDMEATALMWLAVNPSFVNDLWLAAIRLYDGLAGTTEPTESIVGYAQLPFQTQARVRDALPIRDAHWYLATDTGADFRPNTLPAAQGGDLGRLIAQINDVALHIDALLGIAPVLYGRLPYDWFVRSALVVELAALLDLAVGGPSASKAPGRPTLLELCRYGRPKEAASELTRMRDSIPFETRQYIRWCRDKFGAHVDKDLPLLHLHHHLAALDYQGVILVAEHLLDWLDVLGATQLDLKMLVMGERRIESWPLDPDNPDGLAPPDSKTIPGSLARLFRSIDSPYLSAAATTMGSAVVAGISAGRTPNPRKKVKVPRRWDQYLDGVPPHIQLRSDSPT